MVMTALFLVLSALWGVSAHNRLVKHANLAREAWSGIDVQLERRHDLVPNLVAVVEAYAKHEHEVLESVTRARQRAVDDEPAPELQRRENQLTGSLRSLLALTENYPELLANRSFADLHDQLVEIEDRIQMARRYFNGSVRDYNICVESFPSNLVARVLGFEIRSFFELASATEREAPKVEITS
ncbi:MAG: LemA family protein [Deltaproteobacteria bacterium]|nr:LemA family protein [Deltaproteobacteria bacterium]MBW2398546.1 LemA family protein [Deltaproteobacteria bacterium]MBW2665840.1 LemA family protein [Deltaproteobacteria bacterium]